MYRVAIDELQELRMPRKWIDLRLNLDFSSPYTDHRMTRVWRAAMEVQSPSKTKEDVKQLWLEDSLQPDPANRKEVMKPSADL